MPFRPPYRSLLSMAVVALCAGCASIAPPRTDDPYEPFNRRMYAFNEQVDKVAIRPVALGYRTITTQNTRRLVSNFFSNIRMPITIVNDILQGKGRLALRNTGRFAVNTTLGFAGLFDPASKMRMPPSETDFGVTLARWGLPEGPYLVLPFLGPSSGRDIFRMPVDNYLDPLSWYRREHDLKYEFEYFPSVFYLITLRASAIDAESLLEGTYDPYVFFRDAYRQRRLYRIYDGEPPAHVIEAMQGADDDLDVEELLEQQREYERSQNGRKEP